MPSRLFVSDEPGSGGDEVVARVLGLYTESDSAPQLTPQELAVLRHLLLGRTSDREIAELMSIEPSTVARHLRNVKLKHGVCRRAAVVARIWLAVARAGLE